MSIIGWIILGLIAGFIASKIVNRQGEGFFLDILLGTVGESLGAGSSSVSAGPGLLASIYGACSSRSSELSSFSLSTMRSEESFESRGKP